MCLLYSQLSQETEPIGCVCVCVCICVCVCARVLFFGRKAMTYLDSVLKSRDITLLTKVPIVRAMIFPVAIYGCESWTIKKAERRRIDTIELWC